MPGCADTGATDSPMADTDKTTPELNVMAINTDVVHLYERVRAATEADKARRGVRMVDYEGGMS